MGGGGGGQKFELTRIEAMTFHTKTTNIITIRDLNKTVPTPYNKEKIHQQFLFQMLLKIKYRM
jgi:hypothetical protein